MDRKQLLDFANWVIFRKRKLGSIPHNSDLVNIYLREKAQEFVVKAARNIFGPKRFEEWIDDHSQFINWANIDSLETAKSEVYHIVQTKSDNG